MMCIAFPPLLGTRHINRVTNHRYKQCNRKTLQLLVLLALRGTLAYHQENILQSYGATRMKVREPGMGLAPYLTVAARDLCYS